MKATSKRATMLVSIAIIRMISKYFPTTSGFECVLTYPPETRTFSTILEYQANTVGFMPSLQGYSGNYVNFSFDSVDRLPRNTFITFDSEHIVKLSLSEKRIYTIDDGAFVGLPCLHYLDLSKNRISKLTKQMFTGLERLKLLDLRYNSLSELPDYVFSELFTLKVLNLAKNSITAIENHYPFFNLTSLEILDLTSNNLQSISPEALHQLGNLKNLQLGSNSLKILDFQKWDNTTSNLEILNLSNNRIDELHLNLNYTFPSMRLLNLSYNYLKTLDVELLNVRFPRLRRIDINHNQFPCEVLRAILDKLEDFKIDFYGVNNTAKTKEDLVCQNGHKLFSPAIASTTENSHNVPEHSPASLERILSTNQRLININSQMLAKLNRTETVLFYLYTIIILHLAVLLFMKCGVFKKISECMYTKKHRYRGTDDPERIPLMNQPK